MHYRHRNRPKIYFIRGLPGAGKTTVAREVVKAQPSEYVIIDPDEVPDSAISKYRNQIDSELSEKVIRYRINLDQAINALKAGKTIIWTQPWSKVDGIIYTIRYIIKELFKLETTVGHDIEDLVKQFITELKILDLQINQKLGMRRVENRYADGEHVWNGEGYVEQFAEDFENLNGKPLEKWAHQIEMHKDQAIHEVLNIIYPEK